MNLTGSDFLLILGVPLVLAAAVYCLLAWRSPVVFLGFFLWIHIEDLVRIVFGNLHVIFFIKGVLLTAMLFGYAHRQWRLRRRLWEGFPAFVPLCLFFGLAVVQAFNPAITHPLVPIIGFHAQFLYIPMFLLAYQYFDSEQRIRQFLLFTLALTALESLLTLPQMILGPNWWYSIVGKPDTLEMFVAHAGANAGEDLFRPCSIFANAGRFYQYLSVVSTVLVGAVFSLRQPKDRTAMIISFACVAMGIYVTSTRTVMYLFVLTLMLFLVLGHARHAVRLQVLMVAVALGGMVVWALPLLLGRQATHIQNLLLQPVSSLDKAQGSGSLLERLYGYTGPLVRAWTEGGYTGHGLGSNSLGLYFVNLQTDGEEPGYAMLIWEYGVVGLVLWLALMGTIWAKAFRVYCGLKNSPNGPLAFAVLVLVSYAFVYQYIGYQILQNYLVTTYFWVFVAMLFAMERLAAQEIREAQTVAESPVDELEEVLNA